MSARARFVRYLFHSPWTPVRIVRVLRAPPLEQVVEGRVVLVTGASSGIGRATALRLGAAGATVLLVARREAELDEVAAEIGANAHVHPCDMRDLNAVDALAAQILDLHGHVDVLINNAGRSIRRSVEQSYERAHDFDRTMRLNYFAPLHLMLALLPAMRERRSGQIVNVSTMGVLGRPPRWAAYVASKSALDGFSECVASEVKADGVCITNIYFPLVHTPMSAPTAIYKGAPGLSAEEAGSLIAEAIRTRPPRLTPRLGVLFRAAWLLAPARMQSLMSRVYRAERTGR